MMKKFKIYWIFSKKSNLINNMKLFNKIKNK